MKSLEESINHEAQKIGYESCGIIKAAFFEEFATELMERGTTFPLTFVYKTGFKSSLNGDKFRPQSDDSIIL